MSHSTYSPSQGRSPGRDWVDLSLLVIMWGWSFALTKIAVADVSPAWITASRMVSGALVLLGIMVWRGGNLDLSARAVASYVWLALCGNVVPFVLIAWGTQFVPSAVAGMVMGAVPLMVMLLAALLLPDEALTVRKMIGFVCGFVGVVLLMGPETLLGFDVDATRILALLAVVAAGGGYAVHAVSVRLLPPLPDLTRATGVLVAGVFLAVPYALLTDGLPTAVPGAAAAGAILTLGLTTTALSLLVLFTLIRAAGPNFAAMSNYLVPVFALMVGVVFLGERFTLADFAALALVLAGVALAGSRRSSAKAGDAAEG